VLYLSITGIVGSIPVLGIDVCPRLSVWCCPVYQIEETLRWVDLPSKETYRTSKRIQFYKLILIRIRTAGLILETFSQASFVCV